MKELRDKGLALGSGIAMVMAVVALALSAAGAASAVPAVSGAAEAAVVTPEIAARRARLMEACGDGLVIVPSLYRAVQDEVERILMAGLAELGLATDATSAWQKRLHIQHGFGVRIEDDILITEGGNEILSAGVPKETAAIEKMMREKSPHTMLK